MLFSRENVLDMDPQLKHCVNKKYEEKKKNSVAPALMMSSKDPPSSKPQENLDLTHEFLCRHEYAYAQAQIYHVVHFVDVPVMILANKRKPHSHSHAVINK